MGAKTESYTPAFQREASHLVIDPDIAHVARDIGVGEQSLGRGRTDADGRPARGVGGVSDGDSDVGVSLCGRMAGQSAFSVSWRL